MSTATLPKDPCASAVDRDWFEARPKRTLRLRLRLPAEFAASTHVLVVKLSPGDRMRVPLTPQGPAAYVESMMSNAPVAPLVEKGLAATLGRVMPEVSTLNRRWRPR
ncbi:hypothetical protein [Pseudorhodoferax sp. Leaf267]|uniref:hypothetical protein n=1 Tax=Pseudorhodoferax sp. Leaf267 TaxID=1736316 RepID=UPI0012E2F87A|nr:hypothetical protein [Pseudorhodoferax sp. Leaf267]